mgnify:FL=1
MFVPISQTLISFTSMNRLIVSAAVVTLLFVCASADTSESETLAYCNTYFSSAVESCLSIVYIAYLLVFRRRSSDAFLENVEVVKENNDRNDHSVTVSFYTMYARDYFEENMTLNSFPFESVTPGQTVPSRGNADGNTPEDSECKFILEHPFVDRSYPGLDESIDSNVMQYKSYILSGALDLLYTAYRDHRPTFDVPSIALSDIAPLLRGDAGADSRHRGEHRGSAGIPRRPRRLHGKGLRGGSQSRPSPRPHLLPRSSSRPLSPSSTSRPTPTCEASLPARWPRS